MSEHYEVILHNKDHTTWPRSIFATEAEARDYGDTAFKACDAIVSYSLYKFVEYVGRK